MGYSKFKKIKTVAQKFGLSAEGINLFANLKSVNPSAWLTETLKKAKLVPLSNEKTKAERIISPILVEIAEFYLGKVTLFSGEELTVNSKENLAGECDFFFTLMPRGIYLESPIISLVESKDEDMEWGIAQCAAQLYGAKLFNEAENKNLLVLYGCATDGIEWRFIRFENNIFYVDTEIYTDLKEILGVWHHIIKSYI